MTTPDQRARNVQSRLRHLFSRWTLTSRRIDTAHGHAAAMGPREAMKPSLLARWGKWMEQIAGLEKKERDIINEISEIERKHNEMRRARKLKIAHPAPEEKRPAFDDDEDGPKRKLWLWAFIMAIFAAPSRQKKNTPD